MLASQMPSLRRSLLRQAPGDATTFKQKSLNVVGYCQKRGNLAFAYSEAEGCGPISRSCPWNCKGTRLRLRLTQAVWI